MNFANFDRCTTHRQHKSGILYVIPPQTWLTIQLMLENSFSPNLRCRRCRRQRPSSFRFLRPLQSCILSLLPPLPRRKNRPKGFSIIGIIPHGSVHAHHWSCNQISPSQSQVRFNIARYCIHHHDLLGSYDI